MTKAMEKLASEARAKTNLADLRSGSATGEINGHNVRCEGLPINTNSKRQVSLIWFINGKRASRAKVAAL